jgi:prophage regulatory protein
VDTKLDSEPIAETIAELQRTELANAGRAAIGMTDYLSSQDLEKLTGTRASTWRWWASIGKGPASFRLGRRRVWKRSTVLAWLAEQEREQASS